MRTTALPRLSSARESLSAQTRSDVVSGRLMVLSTQSLTPLGCTEMAPEMYCRRATLLGGSAKAVKATPATKIVARMVEFNFPRVFINCPFISVEQLGVARYRNRPSQELTFPPVGTQGRETVANG